MSATVTLFAYKFISLDGVLALHQRALERCTTLSVKGAVLLARAGIHVVLAGTHAMIEKTGGAR